MKTSRLLRVQVLIALWIVVTACGAQRFPEARPLSTTNLETLALEPYTNAEFAFESVVPTGWVEAMPGAADDLFISASPAERPGTALIQRFEPGSTPEKTMQRWLPALSLDMAPDRAGTHSSPSFTWDLYPYQIRDPDMGARQGVIALAQAVDGVYLVALVTQPGEYEALYDAVLLPVVEALTPVAGLPSRYDEYATWPVVAAVEQAGNNARETVDFALDACTRLRLYAIGQQRGPEMVDFGYVENAATGQVVWRMYPFETQSAGYYQNRRSDRALTLPPGDYRLHYHSDATHSFDDWGDQPPGHRFWGITLFVEQDPDGPPPQCLPRAEQVGQLGWSAGKVVQLGAEFEARGLAAVMVLSQGQVILDWGHTTNNFLAHSMRKSLMSALYGIAVERGLVDPGQTLAELGVDDIYPLTEQEQQATVENLLQARSGVYLAAAGEVQSMRDDRPERGSYEPGTHWYYNNWDFNALGTIFEQETGENIYRAFAQWIGEPIGVQDFFPERLHYSYEYWLSQHPYYGFRISARDLARFGQLFLEGGDWQGTQIVPRAWVELSTQAHSRTAGAGTYSGYGYMWWIAARNDRGIPEGAYAASGMGGHTVEVLPSLETVIVLRPNTDAAQPRLLGSQEVDDIVRTILRARTDAD